MVAAELPGHLTAPDATRYMAELLGQSDGLSAEAVADSVAFVASVQRHVNRPERQ
jgi:NADP-dependent 3-hydroxy acid dehydrogenase YdfG